jgi:hypothetical protein
MQDKKFFDRLYLGFEAEHYIAGKFFSRGLEAFRLPADFGFDLLVTDQMKRALGGSDQESRSGMPYAVQVKSRRLGFEMFVEAASTGRLVASTAFPIKREDLDLIAKTSNSFLVCVVFIEGRNGIFDHKAVTFWFDSKSVKKLDELGYFINEPGTSEKTVLNVEIRLFPEDNTAEYLKELEKSGMLKGEARAELEKRLPPRIPRAWNAREYVALGRPSRSKDDSSIVYRMLNEKLLWLERIGESHDLGKID